MSFPPAVACPPRGSAYRRFLGSLAAASIGASVLSVASAAPAAAADTTFRVQAKAANGCTARKVCGSIQQAVNAAMRLKNPGNVLISVGRGRFVERDGVIVHGPKDAKAPTSLTIRGQGARRTTITPGSTRDRFVITIRNAENPDLEFPVGVDSVTLAGARGSLNSTQPVGGILSGSSALLTVRNTVIRDHRGGSTTRDSNVDITHGGSAYGIQRADGPTVVERTVIRNIEGGNGRDGQKDHAAGGFGGDGIGIDVTGGALTVARSVISGSRGGAAGDAAGGSGANGGWSSAGGIRFSPAGPVLGFFDLTVTDTSITDNVAREGGRGADAPTTAPGKNGAPGGAGGNSFAAGITASAAAVTIERTTLAGNRSANAGHGGAGAAADGSGDGGAGGTGGLSTAHGLLLVATQSAQVTNSTLALNVAGDGGNGGNGGPAETGQPGAAGTAGQSQLYLPPGASLSSWGTGLSTLAFKTLETALPVVTHSTIVGNGAGRAGFNGESTGIVETDVFQKLAQGDVLGALDQFSAIAPAPLAVGGGVAALGAVIDLDRSLVHNPAGSDCSAVGPAASVRDLDFLVDSDGSCSQAATSRTLPSIGADLSKLGPYGGPTPTIALLARSPAASAVGNGCAPVDQRGVSRVSGTDTACAAGAFEP